MLQYISGHYSIELAKHDEANIMIAYSMDRQLLSLATISYLWVVSTTVLPL